MAKKFSKDKSFIKKLTKIIKVNLENENFGVLELASEVGLSRSQLHRRLKVINGKSTSQFIREYRLKKAMEMLKRNQFTASEIAYRVGFSSPTYFNTCFNNYYGYPPGEVKYHNPVKPIKRSIPKKLVTTLPLVILLGLIIYNEVFNKGNIATSNIDKTIAVMPFVNDSPNDENLYFCNGIMEGIRDHLAKIPEFAIVSRRSVEKYRDTPKSLKVIAKELEVNYLVEGRVQRKGNRAIISAELIYIKNNKVLWSESFDENISEIFDVQSRVVQSITNELEIVISPSLKSDLDTKPTEDKTAYEYYLKGQEFRFKAKRPLQETKVWLNHLSLAQESYELAIKKDSLYASAYLGLAYTLFERNVNYITDENNLDEVFELVNKVIELAPNYSSAYSLRGDYYSQINEIEKAIFEYEKTLDIIPNNYWAINNLIILYKKKHKYKDALLLLKNSEKFALSRGELYSHYTHLTEFYRILHQQNMVDYYFNKSFEIQTNPGFRRDRVYSYVQFEQFDKAIKYVEETLLKDNQQRNALLGYLSLCKKDYNKALKYYEACYEQVQLHGINSLASTFVYMGYGDALIRFGQVEKGTKMIEKQISVYNEMFNSKRYFDEPIVLLYNAICHASIGQIEQAHNNIKQFDAIDGWMYWPFFVKWPNIDSTYDVLKGDPVFKASLVRGEEQLLNIQNQIRPYLPLEPPKSIDSN